jgi:acyl dehydratase
MTGVAGRVSVGDQVPEWRVASVSSERMGLLAAILRDPNPIHWDRAEVAKRGLGDRLINQGPINVAYVCNALAAWAGPTSLRSLTVRFTANVFDGDEVVAGGVVTAVEPGSDAGDTGDTGDTTLATCDVWLDRSDGTRAVVGQAVVAFTSGREGES